MGILGKKKDKDEVKEKAAAPAKKVVKEKAAPKAKATKKAAPEVAEEPTMADLYAGAETAKKSKSATGAKAKTAFAEAYKVLVHPLITEKAATASSLNKYVFVVSGEANKLSVAQAICAVYGVKPIKVNIVCQDGKVVTRGRIKGRRRDLKKAIVTLKKGDSIQVYEGV